MRIAVFGLWHLGTVTAACLASAGHQVTAIDEDPRIVARLAEGKLPVQEPGLAELVQEQILCGNLRLSSKIESVSHQEVVWLTFDTPVDEDDVADVDYVLNRARNALKFMEQDGFMLISSQMPVGSTARLEHFWSELNPTNQIRFACSPENLRLGRAIECFMKPDRVVVGIRSAEDRERLMPVWTPFTDRIEWMSIESAEMTKHAINAFLATSVTFINEIARICEQTGADAREVERGLKSDVRIGNRAYLHPGPAFAGGTLARDVMFLREAASRLGRDSALFDGIKQSNDLHREWIKTRFVECVGSPQGKNVAVLGLTYKPGTSTLRRSGAVETCRWLTEHGASVRAYDPGVRSEEPEIAGLVRLENSMEKILPGADVLLVTTEWPEFRQLQADLVVRHMNSPVVIDPSGHLEAVFANDERIRYLCVGRGR